MKCAACKAQVEMIVGGFGVCVDHAAELLFWLQHRKGSPVSWWVAQHGAPAPR